MKDRASCKDRRGFTLTELLVCLSIIAVTASFLFPVIKSAKASSKEATCANKLRQMAIAVELYRSDNDGSARSGTQPQMGLPPYKGLLNLPPEIWRCLGTNRFPGLQNPPFAKLFGWNVEDPAAPQLRTWAEYTKKVDSRAVLFSDGNHRNDGKPVSPFYTQFALGICIDTSLIKRSQRGDFRLTSFWEQ
jgi:prepilin-type N-terminal cleavage/methylation domain-containing protein